MAKWIAGLVVSVAMLGAVAWRPEAPGAPPAAPIEPPPEALPPLVGREPRLAPSLASAPPPDGKEPEDVEPSALPPRLTVQAPKVDLLESVRERGQRLQQRWEGEADDAEWTQTARESLAGMFSEAGVAADVIQSVACRATICRIELAFPDFQSATKLGSLAAAQAQALEVVPVAPAEPAAAVPSDDPQLPEPRYVVYAARPGEHIVRLTGLQGI